MELTRKAFISTGVGVCAAAAGMALCQACAQDEAAPVASGDSSVSEISPMTGASDMQRYIGWWVTRGVERAAELPAAGAEILEIASFDEASGAVAVNITRLGPSGVAMRNVEPVVGALVDNRVLLTEFVANTGERCCGSLELHGSNLVAHVYALERPCANEAGGRASIAFESAMAHDRFHDLRQIYDSDGRRLFGHIDDRELDEGEVAHYCPQILVIGLTEPLATRGVVFDTPELDEYYRKRTWYRPNEDAVAEDGQTDIEKANLGLLEDWHARWVEFSNGCGDSLAEPTIEGAPQFIGTRGNYGFAFDDSLAGAILQLSFDEAGQPVLYAVHNRSDEVLVDNVTGTVTSNTSALFDVEGAQFTLTWDDPATLRPSCATADVSSAIMDVLSRQKYVNRDYLG